MTTKCHHAENISFEGTALLITPNSGITSVLTCVKLILASTYISEPSLVKVESLATCEQKKIRYMSLRENAACSKTLNEARMMIELKNT